jgi:porphobilinogen synthase
MVQETLVTQADLIYPLFAVPGDQVAKEVSSMPGVYQLSVDKIVEEAKEVYDLGIPAIILFGIPTDKDTDATGAWHDCGIVQKATTAVKEAVPDLLVIVDTCLCEYTSHGHCGYLEVGDLSGRVLNDPTLELLKKTAVAQANAGADIIAPSGHDGWFCAGHSAGLDEHGFEDRHSFLRREVRLGLLRAVSRCGGECAPVWRSPHLPDGPRQRHRGPQRN